MTYYRITIGCILLLLSACATNTVEVTGEEVRHCDKTSIEIVFIEPPADEFWKNKLNTSLPIVNNILSSDDFLKQCSLTWMTNMQGKSSSEVCREVACNGPTRVNVGFFNKKSKGIAMTDMASGIIRFNTFSKDSIAGTPGNIIHEFTHVLGYKHLTNFRLIAQTSVPYKIGDLADKFSENI